MTTKVEKKFPRREVLERQHECARTVLEQELDETQLDTVRGGTRGDSPDYGLPPPPPDGTRLTER
jgi:hypothetical protein